MTTDPPPSPSLSPSPPPPHSPTPSQIMTPQTLTRTLKAREHLQQQLLEHRIVKWGWCLFCIRILSFTFGIALVVMHYKDIRMNPWNRVVFLDVLPGVLAMISALIGVVVDCCRKSGFRFFCFQTILDLLVLCTTMFGITRFIFCEQMCDFEVALVVMTLELWVFALLLVAFDVVQTVEYHRYKMQLRSTHRRGASALTEVVNDILSSRSAGLTGGAILGDMNEGFRRVPRGQRI
ncbi:hypothetical protein L873DRAFT_1812718 [Choiromyces venosus 120613-1]|uniref:Uncharacterized protein n=1 Tax=Choiromyces venosus 120613-1 TaxID=1336337 RepID=A0A3N4JF53_9PEZI|nr:hypothetical protein L873DRAFT_1812718 [Choiromyces venosus 120613-1]